MTDITELVLITKIKKQLENFDTVILKEDEALALVEALEKAQRYIDELREWNAGLAQESFERQQRISELLEGKVGNALLERENHHVEVVGKLLDCISELESRAVKLPDALLPATHKSGELFMTPDNVEQGGYLNRDDVLRVLRDAGIKVEAE